MAEGTQLSDRFTQTLQKQLQSGKYSGADALPPEVELAQEYNVSRNIVRECLARLERVGWITRKHGVGTLINKQVVNVETRLDLNFELKQTIEMQGKKATTDHIKDMVIEADEKLAHFLQIEEHKPVLRVSRLIRADGKPAIFCIDYIPVESIVDKNYHKKDLVPPIFSFINKFCGGKKVETDLAEIRAMNVTDEVAEAMEIPLTCSLLYLSEVGFDLHSKPVLFSEEYFIDRVIKHVIVRKKI